MVREQNAMLTKTDREFLIAEGEHYSGDSAKQMRYERRQKIRDRIRETLLDFTLLFDYLPDSEQEKLFEDEGGWWAHGDQELQEGARDTIAFILRNADISPYLEHSGSPPSTPATELLEDAYKRIAIEHGRLVTEVANPEIETTNLRNVLSRLEEGDSEETAQTLGLLLQTGEVSEETRAEIQELLRDDLVDSLGD